MKKKIIIGLAAYLVLFLFMGIYIVYTIHSSSGKLSNLIKLHQVEILREHFLIQIKRVQSDIAMKHTPYSRKMERIHADIDDIEKPIRACFGCHHSNTAQIAIDDLQDFAHHYQSAVRLALANPEDLDLHQRQEDSAFRVGEILIEKTRDMISLTNTRLNERTERVLEDIGQTGHILYTLLAVGPLLSLGLAVFFIRGFTKPVNRLLDATRKLKTGDLDHRVDGLKDEFGELGSSFNEMAGSIQDKMAQMREAERTLENANRDLKLAQEQMVRAETMAAIGTLSTGISHQLSTPLGVILNLAELMKQDVKDNSAMRGDIEMMEYEAKQAIKVTRSLLGFSRSMNSVKELVDVNQIVEDIYKIMEFQTSARSVKMEKRLAPDLRYIYANSGNIRQVFLNIILNAIQAMPNGGELVVSSRRCFQGDVEGVKVAFRDTGTGIAAENIKNIFQPFYTTKKDGTGLGLAISYGIICEHNGKIDVESEVGKGTTFRIFLPVGTPPEVRI